ncbi:MAG TPA: hypothetical protein VFK69_14605 [Candidatus Eisenbacteria bacterium]|nr:hypothetical protein [Candidatus Eisenbacteria bacterium]
MFRHVLAAAVLVAGVAAGTTASAQSFQTHVTYAGPRVWLGNLDGAVALGAQAERGLTIPGHYGPGVISAGVGVDWYSWSASYVYPGYSASWHYSVLPLQVFSNYHFPVKSTPQFDPYAGLSLVYSVVSASWVGPGVSTVSATGSSLDLAGQAGARWYFSDRFSVQGQVGFGYGTLGLGATWVF